jgi:glycerophosphoryl diester phosphodiesterase
MLRMKSRKTFAKILTCASIMSAFTLAASAVEIIAHRGASHDAPENTLSSFKLGYKQNADACELDLHLTQDGKIVLMHDFDTLRVSGVSNKIAQTSFADLRKLEIGQWGDWKGSAFHEPIPTLAEALALMPDGKKFFLEIKCRDNAEDEKRTTTKTLPEMKKVLKASGKTAQQTPMITFNYASAKAAKKLMPDHDVYWLLSWNKNKKTGEYPNIDEVIAKAKEAKLDGLDLNSGFPIDKEFVKKVHGAGLKLYTWTVDDPAIAKTEVEAGVDGITTNRPEFLRAELKK